MAHPVTGIDHVFLLTGDLDRAAADWTRLGFTLTPRGVHSAAMGSANHTIMLDGDYIELMGLLRPTEANQGNRRRLAGGQGLHAIACRTADTRAAVPALEALGIGMGRVMDFERPVDLPGGGPTRAAFTVASMAPDAVPRGHVFLCQHHTPEAVWVPAWMNHTNGAKALGAVVAMADDPAAIAAGFARLWAAGSVMPMPGGLRVETGSAPVLVLTPEGVAARYPGLDAAATPVNGFVALEVVADMGRAAAALGELAQAVPGGLAVAPADATGTILAFRAARP